MRWYLLLCVRKKKKGGKIERERERKKEKRAGRVCFSSKMNKEFVKCSMHLQICQKDNQVAKSVLFRVSATSFCAFLDIVDVVFGGRG